MHHMIQPRSLNSNVCCRKIFRLCFQPPSSMNFLYSFLLLLVVLLVYSESPQHVKLPDFFDSIIVTICSNSSSAQLGILAPVLPHNEVYKTILPYNEMFKIDLSQNGILKTILS
jgi:hypothetical protein